MAITTLDGYIASGKQRVNWTKTASRTTIAAGWFSLIDIAGNPGVGTLAGTSTAAGVVPTDAVAGFAPIDAFSGGATGYLSRVEFFNSVPCRIAVFDLLFKAGAYAYNANTALTGQPSYVGRLPGGDYKGLEIWVEQVTAATGNQAVNVSYLDRNGNPGTTGAVGIGAAPTVGRCWQLPLASGDAGVSAITNVAGSVATAGTFNVLVLRRLWATGSMRVNNSGDVHDLLKTGMPQVYDDSALFALLAADSTSSGLPDVTLEIANG